MMPAAGEAGRDVAENTVQAPDAARDKLWDCLLLALVVLLSFALYAPKLGFYSDDWVFLELLSNADGTSFVDLVRALHSGDRVIQQRPAQIVYLAGLYRLFGLNPAPYHWVNGSVFIVNAALLYLVLRLFGLRRNIALAVPLVYALLPNYSTDRFWPAAFQAPVSITFYLVSLYCLLAAQVNCRHRGAWLVCSALAAGASVLAYEVTLPLVLLSPLLVWQRGRRMGEDKASAQSVSLPVLAASALLPAATVAAFKLAVTVRVNTQASVLQHLLYIFAGAVRLNYIVYGLALPYVVWWIFVNAFAPAVALAAIAAAGIAGVYLYRAQVVTGESGYMGWREWALLVAVGLAVFALGYAVFAVNADITFEAASLANRVGIAAALGVALTLVGCAGLVSEIAKPTRLRNGTFSALIALLVGTGLLINNTLALFWQEAFVRQQDVLRAMHEQLGEPPANAVVLLDGVCLENRGAYVFTGERDLESVLKIAYPEGRFEARAISHKPEVTDTGLRFFTHRESTIFPYSERLLIYNQPEGAQYRIASREEAVVYLAAHPFDPNRDCPAGFAWGREGN